MEFNPLDLLASAAELQQKNDDGPERIIVTRQRRNNLNQSKHAIPPAGSQKENREIHSNNNNVKSKAKPSVVIVKKIKLDNINPELEKMFDEHNYGNAKRTNNNKYEQGDENGSDLNKRKKRTSDSSSDTLPSSHSSDYETVSSELKSDGDKMTVVSVGSQASDSNCVHVGKCMPDCSTDKSTECGTSCYCTHNGTLNGTCSTPENETREVLCSNCNNTECSCRLGQANTDSRVENKVNVIHCDDKQPECLIMKYMGKQSDSGITTEHSKLLKTNVESLKLDDKTGEFITETGSKVIIKSLVNEQQINKNTVSTCESKQRLAEDEQHSLDSDKVVHRMVAVKNAKNLKLDSSTVKSTSIITSAKMPYVKVVPSKDISSETLIEKKPETLVINISRGRNITSQLTKSSASNDQSLQTKTDKCDSIETEATTAGNNVGFIKSIVVTEKSGNENNKKNGEVATKSKPIIFTMVSPKSKLEMPNCDSTKFRSSSSCESLKALELTDPVCTDESSTSVHLLSPDRRNPDSMGIVESPVTSCSDLTAAENDKRKITFPFSYENLGTDTGVCDDGNKNENSGITEEVENPVLFSAKLTKSDSALNLGANIADSISDTRELMKESRLDTSDKHASCDNSANDSLTDTSGNEIPIFRFDSDHCYAGAPGASGKIENSTAFSVVENEPFVQSENEEVPTPQGSTSEMSQDSGYEDVTQSPETELPSTSVIQETSEKPMIKNLVPVLVSVNSNGSLTLHDTNLTKTLGGPVLALPENLTTLNSGIKLIPGTSLTSISQPLILSPVGKSTSPILAEAPRLIQAKPESIIGLLSPKKQEPVTNLQLVQPTQQQFSPPKFGTTFKIGTFASFSNTGMGIENNSLPACTSTPAKSPVEEKVKKAAPRSRTNSGKSGNSVVDTLSSLVQKVKGSLSQSTAPPSDSQNVDHIQHDHDYCTKNLMPSVVSSLLEARLLQKDTVKVKVPHSKAKKVEVDPNRDSHKTESKSGKRKRNSTSLTKLDSMDEFDMDSESDTQSISEPIKTKARLEKFLEKTGRTTDPKVKITGSSNFQDQFVYFMNTKKRSRRRESKDVPLPFGTDRVFIPPKPGDIIVPHLTDQDIENLKLRSKQCKQSGNISGYNSLRSEFMAAKYANTQYSGLFSSSAAETPGPTGADDEKSIINTILSMENENLASPEQSDPPSYNESMELYGQGIGNEGNDIMNLFSEQMNLTPEQMDLLYSAVDEVQNSSPGLVGEEKLVSTNPVDPTFGQFPTIPEFNNSSKDKMVDDTSQETTTEVTDVKIAVTTVEVGSSQTTSDGNSDKSATVEGVEVSKSAPSVAAKDSEHATIPETATKIDTADDGTTGVDSEEPVKTEESNSKETAVQSTKQEKAIETETSESTESTNGSADITDATECEKPEETVTETPDAENETIEAQAEAVVSDLVAKVSREVSGVSDTSSLHLPSSLSSFGNSGSINNPSMNSGSSEADIQSNISDNVLFSPSSLRSASGSSFSSDIGQSNSAPLASDISLTQLDILGLDNYKNDLFPDTGVATTSTAQSTSSALTQLTTASSVEYAAPWIVTVSMFWNDLPAIMITNRPFVRLVDIHKQILPAKDTGILKKRCQLMGIAVENCSEMQRYFLVQYGKAFNSKSTLIISQDNAKVLIGYYVNPQPKSVRPDDHKSIIDHRREQLRRIALARRAAMRAQRTSEKKDDPREIKDTERDETTTSSALPVTSLSETPKPMDVPKLTGPVFGANSQGIRSQRATRHKKINFLEMLRGDSASNTVDEETTAVTEKKHKQKAVHESVESKKRKRTQEKMKVVHYTIETDSSETDSVEESDYSSSYDTDSTSDSEVVMVKRPPLKQQKLIPPVVLSKSNTRTKVKLVPANKSFMKDSLKVKIGTNRSNSAPIGIQVTGKSKSTGNASPIYGDKKIKFRAPASVGVRRSTASPLVFGKKTNSKKNENVDSVTNSDQVKLDISSEQNVTDVSTQIVDPVSAYESASLLAANCNPIGVEMAETDLKVSPTLPDEILDTSENIESTEKRLVQGTMSDSTARENDTDENLNSCSDKQGTSSEKLTNIENSFDQLKSCDSDKQQIASTVSKGRVVSPMFYEKSLNISGMKRKETPVGTVEEPLRIIHRDASPIAEPRSRTQLGEVFVERYHNKKSVCVRCYTCRKMMTVDSFLRHLHDVASGGLIAITSTQTVDIGDYELTDRERKTWETFQRKKELFDNNQIPSPDIVADSLVYNLDSEDSNHSTPEVINQNEMNKKPSGPRIIKTPVSPLKKEKVVRKNKPKLIVKPRLPTNGNKPTLKKVSPLPVDTAEGVRSSGRKRKVKQLYPFEEYSFAKFPRLMKNTEDDTN